MPFATINGIRINYLIQGTGPHLLMFAPGGWRSVISRWTAAGGKEAFGQMDGLATLSRHFNCIAYDRREWPLGRTRRAAQLGSVCARSQGAARSRRREAGV